MRTRLALLVLAVLMLLPATAIASLADEQRQGQQLIAQLQAGTKTCGQLSAEDFDHIGEYVMFRALGSTRLHQAMNDRMTAMMGERDQSRMHQLLGHRSTGCSSRTAGAVAYGWMGPGMIGGSGMMGGDDGNGGWGPMMKSGDWNWMMGGAWQNMTRQDWQRLQQRLLGTTTAANEGGGWSPVAIVGVTLAAVLFAGLATFALIRRPFKPPPAATSST